MANSVDGSRQTAQAIANVCTELAEVLAKVDVIIEYNSDQAIDWAGDPLPTYIAEDANGNINGLLYDRASVANAIFSLEQVRKVMNNQAVTQGDHLGNVNKLASPMPLR